MYAPERAKELFAIRVQEALNVALSGRCAILIVPATYPKGHVLNMVVMRVPYDRAHLVRMPGNEVHFDGTRGSVRIYDNEHATYDRTQKRLRDYPIGTPTFLHPKVEGP